MQGKFEYSTYINQINNDEYTNARYARTVNQMVGTPFLSYKQSAGQTFTDWVSAGEGSSIQAQQFNTPTDNTLFRNSQQSAGVQLQNNQNDGFVYRSQTLSNQGNTLACRNNADCDPYPGTTCNPQYQSWTNSKGNQGNYCAVTQYPELSTGMYQRKLTNEGGIGKACTKNSECGAEYLCKDDKANPHISTTDLFGHGNQVGFCAMTYNCPDGSTHYLETPQGAGFPTVPPKNQNNNGMGYNNKEQCLQHALSQQNCEYLNGKYYATYPATCPVPANLRVGGNSQGPIIKSSKAAIAKGATIPSYATNQSSSMGGSNVMPLTSWNINSDANNSTTMSGIVGPLQYEMSINPKP